MAKSLFVGNIPYQISEPELEEMFSQAGAVESVTVMRDRMTGRPRGLAFVSMANDDDAQKAIQQGLQKEQKMMEGMVKGVETMEKKAAEETKK